jgi:arginyl-tRNA--protein-N-Asp/Glu arginylyltransferase
MAYLKWEQTTLENFQDEAVETKYNNGFLFGRIDKGMMDQTRSIRIDLQKFELSSENRRIMRKTEGLMLVPKSIPYANYHWSIGKLGKDFYDTKFGEKTFSANKIKELLTDAKKTNFNKFLTYNFGESIVGYAICFQTDKILHYCYPFYDLTSPISNLGLGMMLRAILWASETNRDYIYLGSAQRPSDTYKLQFEGIEWFDGKAWQTDLQKLKELIA